MLGGKREERVRSPSLPKEEYTEGVHLAMGAVF